LKFAQYAHFTSMLLNLQWVLVLTFGVLSVQEFDVQLEEDDVQVMQVW